PPARARIVQALLRKGVSRRNAGRLSPPAPARSARVHAVEVGVEEDRAHESSSARSSSRSSPTRGGGAGSRAAFRPHVAVSGLCQAPRTLPQPLGKISALEDPHARAHLRARFLRPLPRLVPVGDRLPRRLRRK